MSDGDQGSDRGAATDRSLREIIADNNKLVSRALALTAKMDAHYKELGITREQILEASQRRGVAAYVAQAQHDQERANRPKKKKKAKRMHRLV